VDTNSVPPDVRWAIANFPDNAPRGAVTRFCEQHQIGRTVFYKIRKIAAEKGAIAATEPESRRPKTSPGRVAQEKIDQALAVRVWLGEHGLDEGPISVADKMKRMGLEPPSRATLARAFKTYGVSRPEPKKRPRSANRRFVYPAPNCCWQLDSTQWSLADGSICVIYQLLDDHSRLELASLVSRSENSKDAVRLVMGAIRQWGVPQKLLSDNGVAFNPSRRGYTGQLVELLKDLGVEPITGKPGRPTTQGKNERIHKPLHKWLNARPPAETIPQLQAMVNEFDEYYNKERGHQALGMLTPWEAWQATPTAPEPTPEPRLPPVPIEVAAKPPSPVLPLPAKSGRRRKPRTGTGSADRVVLKPGIMGVLGCSYYLGSAYVGKTVHVLWDDKTVEIFDATTGDSIAIHPRPTTGRQYFGARDQAEPLPRKSKTAPSSRYDGIKAPRTGVIERKVWKNGCVAALTCRFYVSHLLAGATVKIEWDDKIVTIKDDNNEILRIYPRPVRNGERYGPKYGEMSTKS